MNDKKFKLFGKISVVDIFFAIVVVVFIWAMAQFSAPLTVNAKTTDQKVKFTVECFKKEADFMNTVVIGSTVFDSVKGYELGKIVAVSEIPYEESVPDFAANVYRSVPIAHFKNVKIDVEATVQVTEKATTIGQFDLSVAKTISISTKEFASTGIVEKIENLN